MKPLCLGVVYDKASPEMISRFQRDLINLRPYNPAIITTDQVIIDAAHMVAVKCYPFLCMARAYLCYTQTTDEPVVPPFAEAVLHRCMTQPPTPDTMTLTDAVSLIDDSKIKARPSARSPYHNKPSFGKPNAQLVRLLCGIPAEGV